MEVAVIRQSKFINKNIMYSIEPSHIYTEESRLKNEKGLEPSVESGKKKKSLKVPTGAGLCHPSSLPLPQPLHPSHTGQLSISPSEPRTLACAILANGVPLPVAPSTF